MQLVLNFPQKMLAKELAALAVNLSLNPRNAQMMASQRGLPHLVDRVTETKDPLLMKARDGGSVCVRTGGVRGSGFQTTSRASAGCFRNLGM